MRVSGGLESAQNVSETVTTTTSVPGEKIRTRRTTVEVGAASRRTKESAPSDLDGQIGAEPQAPAGGPHVGYTQVSTEQTVYRDDEVTCIQNSVETTSPAFASTRSERREQNPDGSITSTSLSVQDVPGLKTRVASSSTVRPDGTVETNTSNSISGTLAPDTETKTQTVASPNGDTHRIEMVSTGGTFDKTVTTTMAAFDSASGQTRTKVTTVKSGQPPQANVTVTKPANPRTGVSADELAQALPKPPIPTTQPENPTAEPVSTPTSEALPEVQDVAQVPAPEPVLTVPNVEQVAAAEPVVAVPNVEPVAVAEPVVMVPRAEPGAVAEPVATVPNVEQVAAAEPVLTVPRAEPVAAAEPVATIPNVAPIPSGVPQPGETTIGANGSPIPAPPVVAQPEAGSENPAAPEPTNEPTAPTQANESPAKTSPEKKSVSVVIPDVEFDEIQDDVTTTAQIPIALIQAD